MKQSTMRNIAKVDTIARQILNISAIVFFSLLLLWLLWGILTNNIDVSISTGTAVQTIFKAVCGASLGVFIISVIVRMILSLFVKSDEESDFEAKVDYVLKQKKSPSKRVGQETEVVSVLVELSAEQEDVVCRLLRELPSHVNNPQKINMAEVSHYLTALRDLGYLNDKDKYNLYAWVGKITDKELPQFNHFNESYPSTTVKKVNQAKENISLELQKLR